MPHSPTQKSACGRPRAGSPSPTEPRRPHRDVWNAMRAHDVDGAPDCCSDQLVYDDRRRVSGDPVAAERSCGRLIERLFAQYTQFEARTLAVRGENLHLRGARSYNDAGFETTCLSCSVKSATTGGSSIEGRFDEDDFEERLSRTRKALLRRRGRGIRRSGCHGHQVDAGLEPGRLRHLVRRNHRPRLPHRESVALGFPGSLAT